MLFVPKIIVPAVVAERSASLLGNSLLSQSKDLVPYAAVAEKLQPD